VKRFSAIIILLLIGGCAKPKDDSKNLTLPVPINNGYEVGNGGTVVVCKNSKPQIVSVELLDFYIARLKWIQFHAAFGNYPPVKMKVSFALSRLSRLDAARAASYQNQADRFDSQTRFTDLAILPDTNDYGDVALPAGCTIEQMIIQKNPIVDNEARYLIYRPLWSLLDADNQAGAMLHEIIYRDAIAHGHKNSIKVRALNAIVSSDELQNYDQEKYNSLMVSLNMENAGEQPPVWSHNPLVLEQSVCIGQRFALALGPFTTLPVEDTVSFRALNAPSWIDLSEQGILSGTPPDTAIGFFTVSVRAKGAIGYADAYLTLGLLDCRSDKPILLRANPGSYFTYDLPNIVGMTFYSKVSGADWLQGSVGTGKISGFVPGLTEGHQTFVFRLFFSDVRHSPVEFTIIVN
jgi:hypothetical protein